MVKEDWMLSAKYLNICLQGRGSHGAKATPYIIHVYGENFARTHVHDCM